MLKYTILLLVACSSLVLCHDPDIKETFIRMPNGDESEIVSIDLRKRDGSEDIKLLAQLRFHLNENQVHVNGHPVKHNVVTQLRMRVTIIEIEAGVQKSPRLAPVIFRVLVLEQVTNGRTQVSVEEEFIKVEEDEVMQVDIKQIVWDGTKRLPMASISYEDSKIHHMPHLNDHHLLVPDHAFQPPRLPNENGYAADDEYMRHHHPHHGPHHRHHHHRGHWRVVCWFRRLSVGGKIAVGAAGIVTVLSLLLSLIICWKRHCHKPKSLHMEVPMDNSVVVDGCDDKDAGEKTKMPAQDGEFHMELNDCYVDVSDKKKLVDVE